MTDIPANPLFTWISFQCFLVRAAVAHSVMLVVDNRVAAARPPRRFALGGVGDGLGVVTASLVVESEDDAHSE
jgi:glycerol dehydrogenase-like iron-containing ADH family enzyme